MSAQANAEPVSSALLLLHHQGGLECPLMYVWASLVAQVVENLPAMQDTRVLPLGREDGQDSMEGVMWSVEK